MYLRRLLNVFLFALAILWAPSVGLTQNQSSNMEEIVKSASQSGMQVIVISPSKPTEALPPVSTQLPKSYLVEFQERSVELRNTIRERLSDAPASFEEVLFILNGQSPSGHWFVYIEIVFYTLLLLLASEFIVSQIFSRRTVGPWFSRQQKQNPVGYTDKLPILLLRTFLEVLGLLAVVLLSYGLGYAIFGETDNGTVQLTVLHVYITYFTSRAVVFVWRMILSPILVKYRLTHFNDTDAKRLYYWLLSVATIAAIVVNLISWTKELGLSYNVHALFQVVLTFCIVLLNVAMILVNRRAISKAILAGIPYEESTIASRFASHAWSPSVILYFFFAWGEMTLRLILEQPLGQSLITGFYMILLTVLIVYGLVGYIMERAFHRHHMRIKMQAAAAAKIARETDGTSAATDPEESKDDLANVHSLKRNRMRSFEDLSRRLVNVFALVAGIWALVQIWQIDIEMMGMSETNRSYDIIFILFLGYFIYHFVRIWIDTKIQEEGGDMFEVAPGDEGGAGGASRLATLLPLFRNFLLLVIIVAVALIALTEIGINVSALFAGAGVVGLAIGFGAQALVRDIFSGAFFLFDDAFRKGEYVDIGSVKGTVEKISVRSFQLRHHLGPLHTVPFGEILHLTNFSRDWVMMKLPLRVTYDTDVEKVRKLVKNLGLQLLEDEVVGDQFLQPLKSQGVIEMQDSAMIIRVKFMTKPGDQWVLRKRVYQEIRDLFAKEGIKFAHREVTVRLADGKVDDLTDKQKEAISSAALMAAEDMGDADMQNSGDDR